MNSKWSFLFFSLLFSLTVFANAKAILGGGGTELVIVISKTGNIVCTAEIPKKYVDKNGETLVPIQLSIHQANKQPIYSLESNETNIILPEVMGEYSISICIGDYIKTYIIEE